MGVLHIHSGLLGIMAGREGERVGSGEGKWANIFTLHYMLGSKEDPYLQAQACNPVSVSLKSKKLWKKKKKKVIFFSSSLQIFVHF